MSKVHTDVRKFFLSCCIPNSQDSLLSIGDHTQTPSVPAPPPSLASHTTGDWVLFHPVYTKEELKSVQVLQHERKTMSDKAAAWFVHTLRSAYPFASPATRIID